MVPCETQTSNSDGIKLGELTKDKIEELVGYFKSYCINKEIGFNLLGTTNSAVT